MMLVWLLLMPAAAALMIAAFPRLDAKRVAMAWSLATLAAAGWIMWRFEWSRAGEFQFQDTLPLVPELGVKAKLGVDSVALWLVALTAFLQPLCVWGSFAAITERARAYYAWLMALQAAMLGVFVARDLIFFYVCFEFTLLPMFVLISLWGSTNRKRAAIKFFLYTFTGSIIALAGLVYVARVAAQQNGTWTFGLEMLEATARGMSRREQTWVLIALMAGFAVKVPLFPLHTWLPLAHTEAPTAGSVILAGVLLKLGTYAIYRFVLTLVPLAVVEQAHVIAVISIIGIVYGGLVCWVQKDVKKLVAYSSVAHLGFCILGLFALNTVGAAGSVMYMINHGLSTGALFFCIGMMYERYHTRSMDEVGGLASRMPIWAFFMVFFTLASVGLPGLNGFVSEFMCLMGTFQSGSARLGAGGTGGPLGPWYATAATTGMIVAAIYLLFMVGKVVFGPLREPHGAGHGHAGHPSESHAATPHGPSGLPADLTGREIGVLAPLALACLVLGVYPTPMLRSLEAPIARTLAGLEKATNDTAQGAGTPGSGFRAQNSALIPAEVAP